MATNQKTEFKFIHGIASSDKIISGKEDTLLAAYTNKEGNAVTFTAPLGLTNDKEFQDAMVAAADANRCVTIFTSNIGMLVPNCTVTNNNTLTIDSFAVKEEKARSGTAILPEKVRTAFQTVSNYGNEVACEIQGAINWNRGDESSQLTSAKLTINGKEKTFSNCKFTITGKVDKTEFELANGAGSSLTLYDNTLSLVNTNNKPNAEYYKSGKGYNESIQAKTITRTAYATQIKSLSALSKVDQNYSSITIPKGYILSTSTSAPVATTSAPGGSVNLSLPNNKGGKKIYYLYKYNSGGTSGAEYITSDTNQISGAQIAASSITLYEANGTSHTFTKNGNLDIFTTSGNVAKGTKLHASYTSPYYQCLNTSGQTIVYDKDVYLGEKVLTKVWDSKLNVYDVDKTAPTAGPLYTEKGTMNIVSGKLMSLATNNDLYYEVSSEGETNINATNTSLSANTISGTVSAPNWKTDVKDNTVVKSVIIQ